MKKDERAVPRQQQIHQGANNANVARLAHQVRGTRMIQPGQAHLVVRVRIGRGPAPGS